MNRRASCVGTFEVFEAAHVALRTLLAFSQPVNCIFWPIGMLNWLVAASKLHKRRETCCTAEWPFYSFLTRAKMNNLINVVNNLLQCCSQQLATMLCCTLSTTVVNKHCSRLLEQLLFTVDESTRCEQRC